MRRLSPVVTVLAVAVLAAACSDNTAGGGSNAGPAGWPAPTGRLDGVTLTMWTAQNSAQTPKSVIAAFHAATGATVNTVTVPDPYEQGVETKVATGDKP